jgi:hypothetical protein
MRGGLAGSYKGRLEKYSNRNYLLGISVCPILEIKVQYSMGREMENLHVKSTTAKRGAAII